MTRAFIAWQGPSPVDGSPLVLIVTGPSNNTKTGPMYQAWLLLRDHSPFDGLRTGADQAICGDCVHRSGEKRTCYVSMFHGPIQIWRKFLLGFYPTLSPEQAAAALRGESLRITAYGDPAFVPFELWQTLLSQASGWAGYTHQWRTCDSRFKRLLMASVESTTEACEAERLGWRTFRARAAAAALTPGEFACPASDEAGHRTTCLQCQLCRGTSSPAKSVSLVLHGKGAGGRGAADRKGIIRGRYDELRQQLRETGAGELFCAPEDRARAVLALRQYYRRRNEPTAIGTKRLGNGAYRFFVKPVPEASVVGVRV